MNCFNRQALAGVPGEMEGFKKRCKLGIFALAASVVLAVLLNWGSLAFMHLIYNPVIHDASFWSGLGRTITGFFSIILNAAPMIAIVVGLWIKKKPVALIGAAAGILFAVVNFLTTTVDLFVSLFEYKTRFVSLLPTILIDYPIILLTAIGYAALAFTILTAYNKLRLFPLITVGVHALVAGFQFIQTVVNLVRYAPMDIKLGAVGFFAIGNDVIHGLGMCISSLCVAFFGYFALLAINKAAAEEKTTVEATFEEVPAQDAE